MIDTIDVSMCRLQVAALLDFGSRAACPLNYSMVMNNAIKAIDMKNINKRTNWHECNTINANNAMPVRHVMHVMHLVHVTYILSCHIM